jgi:hypothetical protein
LIVSVSIAKLMLQYDENKVLHGEFSADAVVAFRASALAEADDRDQS